MKKYLLIVLLGAGMPLIAMENVVEEAQRPGSCGSTAYLVARRNLTRLYRFLTGGGADVNADAALDGDVPDMRRGARIRATVLMEAARHGRHDIVRLMLIAAGREIDLERAFEDAV